MGNPPIRKAARIGCSQCVRSAIDVTIIFTKQHDTHFICSDTRRSPHERNHCPALGIVRRQRVFALAESKGAATCRNIARLSLAQMASFKSSGPIECADDEVALKKAKQFVDGHHVELWQFTRKIATSDRKSRGIFQA
jgi:hypothetical protein